MWQDHTLIQILSFSRWKNVRFFSLSHMTHSQCSITEKPSEKKTTSISVFCRIILWRHHQTSSFSRSSVHRFNYVYHLLLVLHRPVDLVVVTGAQINHDVFVPETQASTTWGSDTKPSTTVSGAFYLKKNMTVQGSYSSYILLKSGTSVMSTR